MYCHSYYGVHGYSDRGVLGVESGSTRTVTVTMVYTDTLTGGVGGREWQHTYSTCTVTVTMVYTDTLTGGVGGREWQYTYSTCYYQLLIYMHVYRQKYISVHGSTSGTTL